MPVVRPRSTLAQHARRALVLLPGLMAGCASDQPCIVPPCLAPFAVQLTVRSAATLAPITGAFVLTAAGAQPIDCGSGSCVVPGTAGTYTLDIGAPGYRTISKSVVVTGTSPRCGCPVIATQQVDAQLTPG